MTLPTLHIADRNYSSWSMRPWLALKHGGIAFEERLHVLPELGGVAPAFGAISPSGKVPALELDGEVIADSLAICEWAAEQSPSLWPRDAMARTLARSASAMMHSGFAALRTDAPMNIRRRTDPGRMTQAGLADAAQMDTLWQGWLRRSGGPYLFGAWSIADAMYAPAATRFVTYGIAHSTAAGRYIDALTSEPHMARWIAAAHAETRALARSDAA
ncbi:MAG: glutathione S-transferase family protein [Alphaproteobacteria bacterium]|nr:glutathione S-transferase family protein [Alphaproteobacteria bacterium]